MIRATFFRGDPDGEPTAEVSIESNGHVAVTRGAVCSEGTLPRNALARIAERVRDVDVRSSRVGTGPRSAILTTSQGAITVRFEGEQDPEQWKVATAGDLIVVLARVARAIEHGSLSELDTGLPDAIDREGLLLRFTLGPAFGDKPTIVLYGDGRWESWRLLGEWTGTRLRRATTDRDGSMRAHAAVRALADRLRDAGRMPTFEIAHDPTDAMDVTFAGASGLERLTFLWGRASRNDAYLSPVPEGVPIALFNDAFESLLRLRDFPEAPSSTDPPPATAPKEVRSPSVIVAESTHPTPPETGLLAGLLSLLDGIAPKRGRPASRDDLRIDWLRQIRAHLAEGATLETVARLAETAPQRITVQGNLNGDDLQMSFVPPLSARAFIEAMQIQGAVTYAGGNDMNVFDLLVKSTGQHPHPYTAPSIGPFEVTASLHDVRDATAVARWHDHEILDVLSADAPAVYHLVLRRRR